MFEKLFSSFLIKKTIFNRLFWLSICKVGVYSVNRTQGSSRIFVRFFLLKADILAAHSFSFSSRSQIFRFCLGDCEFYTSVQVTWHDDQMIRSEYALTCFRCLFCLLRPMAPMECLHKTIYFRLGFSWFDWLEFKVSFFWVHSFPFWQLFVLLTIFLIAIWIAKIKLVLFHPFLLIRPQALLSQFVFLRSFKQTFFVLPTLTDQPLTERTYLCQPHP